VNQFQVRIGKAKMATFGNAAHQQHVTSQVVNLLVLAGDIGSGKWGFPVSSLNTYLKTKGR